jgi:hypothetical protein
VLASRPRNTMGLSGAGAEPAHAAQARLPGKDRFGPNAAVAKSRCVSLARLAQDGSSALARLSFHLITECSILAGEPLLARPII